MPSHLRSPSRVGYLLAAVATAALVRPAPAQAPADPQPLAGAFERLTSLDSPCSVAEPPAPTPFGGPIHDRPKLTGDWFGARSGLRDRGVTVDVSTTQFYQGVTTGGLERSFPYGGRNDYFLTLDGEKLGLWKGLFAKMHGETRYGESANFNTGALSPVNEFLLVPAKSGVASGLTGVKVAQFLSQDTAVIAGKINLFDEIVQPLTGASGLEGFQNVSLLFNTVLARALPYSTFGAGFLQLKDGHPVFAVSVFDTIDRSTTSAFDRMFGNGAVVFSTAILPTQFFDLPGHYGVEGVYSSGRYTNVDQSAYLDPITGLVAPSAPRAGTWAVGVLCDQALWVSPDDPKRVWGVFGKAGIADANPNPIRWTASGGVSGASPIPGRPRDTFGAGYFYLGISDTFKRSARPLTPLRDEQGVELYYNTRVTPWLQLTPDLQVVVPFQRQAATVLLVGLRAKIDF